MSIIPHRPIGSKWPYPHDPWNDEWPDHGGLIRDIEKSGLFKTEEVNVYEIEGQDEMVYEVDVPGVEKKDINLEFSDDKIQISFSRNTEVAKYIRSKYWTLPKNLDPDNIRASLENGVLTIKVPKLKSTKPKKIEITG